MSSLPRPWLSEVVHHSKLECSLFPFLALWSATCRAPTNTVRTHGPEELEVAPHCSGGPWGCIWGCKPFHPHWVQQLVVPCPMQSGIHYGHWEAWGHQVVDRWSWWDVQEFPVLCERNVCGQQRLAALRGRFCLFLHQQSGHLLYVMCPVARF